MARTRPGEPLRLLTIRFSHYCEKARWALDRAALRYRESSHLPFFSWFATYTAGGRRTVPVLLTPDGALSDSTDILRWVDAHGEAPPLFPADLPEAATLEDEYDRALGPHARRLVYAELLPHAGAMRRLLPEAGPAWQARVAAPALPVLTTLMRRGMRIDQPGVTRSRERCDQVFAAVAARLADGRRYLCGDRFTAADLTFAALAAPLLLPETYAAYLPPTAEMPAQLRDLVEAYRATPAGQFALRLYADHRAT